jgi:hypothetical protein
MPAQFSRLVKIWDNKFGYRRGLMTTDDVVLAGKPFIVLFTNGTCQQNPMRLSECMVCGEVFTRERSRKHNEAMKSYASHQRINLFPSQVGEGGEGTNDREHLNLILEGRFQAAIDYGEN